MGWGGVYSSDVLALTMKDGPSIARDGFITGKKGVGLVKTTRAISFILLGMSFLLQGCILLAVGAGAAAGVGAVAYLKGELQTTYAASLDRTWEASLDALKDLNYRVISSEKGGAEGNIEAKLVGGDEVKISLSIPGPGTTLVKIRVGVFGDESVSRTINSKIASNLGVQSS